VSQVGSDHKATVMPVHWLVFVLVPALVGHFYGIRATFERALLDDRLSHVLALPIVGLILLWLDGEDGYQIADHWQVGAGVLAACAVLAGLRGGRLFEGDQGAIIQFFVFLVALCCGFACLYGWETFARQRFAFFVFALSTPPPEWALQWFETFLQTQSANAAEPLFRFIGISYLRHDTVFSLPGMVIEVARECSGVRSAIAILAATVLGSRLAIQSPIGRVLLCASAIPIAIAKNAVRIALLAGCGLWISPDILRGPLHKYGGPVFSVVAVLLFVPLVVGLQWVERRWQERPPGTGGRLGGT